MSLDNRNIATSIDSWEQEFKDVFDERLLLVKKVGELKKKYGEAFHVQAQWNIVLNKAKEIGRTYGLDGDTVEEIWDEIHELAKGIERAIEFDGEIVDDNETYQKEIQPLRDEILRLNSLLLQSVHGILTINGATKGKKIVLQKIKKYMPKKKVK